MKTTSIKKNFMLSMTYQILILIIPFITAPYISRVLGASGVGIYSYTNSIQMYFSLFAVLGTISYGTREISRNRDDKYVRTKLFWEIELLTIITTMICFVFWLFLILFSKEYKIYYMILSLNLIAVIFDISWFFTGLEELKYIISKNTFFKIFGVILVFLFVKTENDTYIYLFIMGITTLLSNMSMWIQLRKFLTKIDFKELKIKKHFKETLVYFVPTIATSIYTILDKTLIGFITKDNNENGYYEQATKIINIAKTLTFTSLNTILGSRISYLFAENRIEEIKKKLDISMNYMFFIGIGMIFGIWSVSSEFVPFYFGAGYAKAVDLINILAPLIVIIGISNCLGAQYYNPAGLRSQSSVFIIIGASFNLFLNILLIPKFWSIGAAISTIIAEIVITFLYLKNCNNFFEFKKIFIFSYKKVVAAIIMFVFITIEKQLVSLNIIMVMGINIITGLLVYIGVLIALKDSFVIEVLNKLIKRKSIENENIK